MNRVIWTLILVFSIHSMANGQGINYVRIIPNGPFRTPNFWIPFNPAPPQMFGPGGTTDSAFFDLGHTFATTYTITDVFGVNNQLIIRNDSLQLEITDYETDHTGVAANSSIIIGRNNGEVGLGVFTGGDGDELRSVNTSLGLFAGSRGSAFVSGDGFRWDSSGTITVGDVGIGNLVTTLQAFVLADFVNIAVTPNSSGHVSVSNEDTRLAVRQVLRVGFDGEGDFTVTDNGTSSSSGCVIGHEPGSSGTFLVEEGGSHLTGIFTSNFIFGREGSAVTNIRSGGRIFCNSGYVARFPGSTGEVDVRNSDSQLVVFDDLVIGGDLNPGPVNGGTGTVSIRSGGELYCRGSVMILPGGTFRLSSSGNMYVDSIEMLGGEFDSGFGNLQVDTFFGDFDNDAAIIAPGDLEGPSFFASFGNTVVFGDYNHGDNAELEIEIGGPPTSTGFDFVNVTGSTILAGDLRVELAGFTPTSDHEFTVLISNGDIFGFFDNVGDNDRLPVEGGSFLVRYGATSAVPNEVVLSDYQPDILLGDVNDDGVVDLLDVAPFVNVLTTGPYDPAADINMDGEVNLLDVAPFVQLIAG